MTFQQINIGFAGPGWIGKAQLRKLAARKDVRITSLFSPRADRAISVLDELGLSRELYVPTYEQMVNRADVDAVWIASPNGYHGEQSLAALTAGKHVFCEKPCATKFEDFQAQLRLARAYADRVTLVDYVLYFDPLEQRIRSMVRAGLLGRLTQVQVNYRHPINTSDGRTWKYQRGVMGDAIGMGVIHALSVMTWIFGADQQHPVAVYATSESARVRPFEVDPIWNIFVRFSGGGTGFCFGNIEWGNGYDAYHNLYGTEGAFVFDPGQDQKHKVRYWSQQHAKGHWIWPLDLTRCEQGGLTEYAWPPDTSNPDSGDVLSHSLDEAIDDFLSNIHAGTQSVLSFESTSAIAEIGWAAQLSAITGAEVRLPLDVAVAAEHLSLHDR